MNNDSTFTIKYFMCNFLKCMHVHKCNEIQQLVIIIALIHLCYDKIMFYIIIFKPTIKWYE